MTEKELSSLVGSVIENLNSGGLNLSKANALIDAVLKKAEEIGVKAVVAVYDAHSNPISVQCMDGSYIASYDIAVNKAYTVTALKMSTSKLKTLAQPEKPLYGIQFTNQGKIVIFGGGDPLYDKTGTIVGGLGVSGGTEEEDTYLSEYGANYFTDKIS